MIKIDINKLNVTNIKKWREHFSVSRYHCRCTGVVVLV
jgi:hypothetical protein